MNSQNLLRKAIKHKYNDMFDNGRLSEKFTDDDLEQVIDLASSDFLSSIDFFFIGDYLSKFELENQNEFRNKNEEIWGELFRLLNSYVSFSIWTNQINQKYFTKNPIFSDHELINVLFSLHARTCLISKEILVLLKSGYPDAAISRWRTLNEFCTTLYFIISNGNECAKRFLDHSLIDRYNSQKILKAQKDKYPKKLNHIEFDIDNYHDLCKEVDKLKKVYGSIFTSDYGWIDGFVQKAKKYGYRTIERAVELDHLQPFSKLANHYVHSSSESMFYSLSSENGEDINFEGSYKGLAFPLDCTLVSMNVVNNKVLSYLAESDNELKSNNTLAVLILDFYFHEIRFKLSKLISS